MSDRETVPLAGDFPAATQEEWRKLVETVLKGAPFERLVGATYDGLPIKPLAGRRPDTRPIAGRAAAAPWQVLARIEHPDPLQANATALHELENGATGLSLVFAGAIGDYGFGLPATEDALRRALEDFDFGAGAALELDVSPHAAAMVDAALAKGFASSQRGAGIRVGHDPLGAMAVSGRALKPWRDEAPHFARRLAALAREGFGGKLAATDGRVIHNAGGSEAQELAYVIAVALAYLRALEAEGMALDAARRMIFFRLAADTDQFLTIAKFRALRKLWARVEAACGLAAEPAFVSAETAWRVMAQRDPHVNILRATIAVFAAAVGGADAITVLPFTVARGLPERFARRVARNTQLLLLEESHLDKVADPAAGSGTVEDLTDELCRAAWTLFHEIEAAGGAAAALESGLIRDKVAAIYAKRAAATARHRDALTGVSIFPNLHETETAVDLPAPATKEAVSDNALRPIRLGQPFEALRDASDRILAAKGARPKIFLANLGTQAQFTTRATFAKNFFEAGGIEAVINDSFASLEDMVSFLKKSGATLACLCSSDDVYAREAVAAARALSPHVKHLYLAGRPPDQAALQQAGVGTFIYAGCEALTILQAAHQALVG